MVIDKGMPLNETRDFLELCGDYVDFLKLGFGTSALYPEAMLREKISMARQYGVESYPGGTFFEVALAQGRLTEYLARAGELGFVVLELSDGTLDISRSTRDASIAAALATGFTVITEVGKKGSGAAVSFADLADMAEADLSAGAIKVIIEGRESGMGVGVFDAFGGIAPGSLQRITLSLSTQDIIWEAPMKSQQESFVIAFGPNVNLGNIPASEALALETLRIGLRGDTFRVALAGLKGA